MAMQSGFIKRIRDIMRMDAGINGELFVISRKSKKKLMTFLGRQVK